MKNPKCTKVWFVSALTFLACAPTLATAAIHVELGVANSALYVISNDAKCPDEGIDCIQTTKGDEPDIFFDLAKACKDGGPQYRLSQFRIAMAEKQWPNPDYPLPAYAADDFNADPNTGIVDLTAGNNQLKDDRIKLKDSNSDVYTVYYEVQAVPCAGGDSIVLDPAIRNTGK